MKTTDLREIMRLAWRMLKITGRAFDECLRRAWANFKLRKAMQNKIVELFYVKSSTGELRQAFGTLQRSVIEDKIKGSERKENEMCFTYYDCEQEGFRSFKRFNLVKIVNA